MSTIVIRVEGTDITDDVILAEATFSTSVGAFPGEFDIRVKDPTVAYDFKASDNITLDIDGIRSFDGYVLQASKTFAFPVVDTADPQVLMWHLRGPDINILFTKRFVYKVGAPRTRIADLPVGTTDLEALNLLFSDWLPLSGDSITDDFNEVGVITPDEKGLPFTTGDTWQTAMYNISQLPGAVWGIKPNRVFYYEDDDTESAPFRLSDTPNNSTSFGYSNMDWLHDGTKLVNDSLFWGAGLGSDDLVYSRVEDDDSIDLHGRWQTGQIRGDVWRQTTANKISESIVYGSPQNLHGGKDDSETVTCRIVKPGLTPGDKVHITSNVFGISKILPIRRMTMTFPNPEAVLYDLNLSFDIDRPYSYHNRPRFPRFDIDPPPPWLPGGDEEGGCQDCGITDSFERVVAAGWGTSDMGLTWNIGNLADNPQFSIASGQAVYTSASDTPGPSTTGHGRMRMFPRNWPLAWTLETRFLVGSISDAATMWPFINNRMGNGRSLDIQIAVDGINGYIQLDGEPAAKQFVNFAMGGFFILKWDYDVTTGIAKAKCWHDGVDPEPDWQIEVNYGIFGPDGPITDFFIDIETEVVTSSFDYIHKMDYLSITDMDRCRYYKFDNFDRTVLNNTSGWGVSSSGPTWDRVSVNGVEFRVDTVATSPSAAIQKRVASGTAADGLQGVSLPVAISSSPTITVTALARAAPANQVDLYFKSSTDIVRALLFNPQTSGVTLRGDPSGSSDVTGSMSWAGNSRKYLKWEVVQGVSNKFKTWLDGEPEPSTWLLETTDATSGTGVFFDVLGGFPSTTGINNTISLTFIDFDYDGKPCYYTDTVIDDFNRADTANTYQGDDLEDLAAWGTPTRGAPDWVGELDVFGATPSVDPIASFAITSGVGRLLFTSPMPQGSPSNTPIGQGRSRLDLSEYDKDEIAIEFDVSFTPSLGSPAASSNGFATTVFYAGLQCRDSFGNDVSLGLISAGWTKNWTGGTVTSQTSFLAAEARSGSTTLSTTLSTSGLTTRHVSINRSVARGTTIISVDGFAVASLSASGTVNQPISFFTQVESTVNDIAAVYQSTLTIDNIVIPNTGAVAPAAGGVVPFPPTAGSFGCESPEDLSGGVYQTSNAYVGGSLDVYVDGTRQRLGVDYFEAGLNEFYLTSPGGNVYCCYLAYGQT